MANENENENQHDEPTREYPRGGFGQGSQPTEQFAAPEAPAPSSATDRPRRLGRRIGIGAAIVAVLIGGVG
ncbi:MAG: hypothetical protein AAGC90_15415, partial [Curtobacterium sp.]